MTTEQNFQVLQDRLDIPDVLYRFGAGVDLNDEQMVASALTEDVLYDFTPSNVLWGTDYPVVKGRDTIVGILKATSMPLDTTHVVTNPRITLSGDTAKLYAIMEAQHLPPADHSRHCLMKNRYDADLVRTSDGWRIRKLVITGVWFTGDPGILSGK